MSELIHSIGPQDLAVGFAPDVPGKSPPVLDRGFNVAFTDLSAQPIAGQFLLINDVGEPIIGVRATIIGGQRYAFVGTPTRLLRWDGSALVDVSRPAEYSGDDHSTWIIERWGEWVLATNGVDPVQVYKGTAFEDLTGTTFATAEIIVVAPGQPFVLAFETVGGAEGGFGFMHWCDRDDVELWTGTLSNFAGFLPIRNIVSPVRAALAMSGVIPFFTADAMYVANFIGHPLSFAATKVTDGIGVLGKFAVCSVGNQVYGLSGRGAWMSDLGGNYRYFDVPLVREFFLSRIKTGQSPHHPVVWHNRAEHSVVFFYPGTEEHGNTEAITYNYLDQNWTIYSYGRSCVDDQGIFDFALAGDQSGNLYYQAAPGQIGTEAPLPGVGIPGVLPISEDFFGRAGYDVGGYDNFVYGGPTDG